jgi:hypothetical protein
VSAANTLAHPRCQRPPDPPALPGLRARALARVLAHALDGQLAEGVVPWFSRVHAARSIQLTSSRSRRALARSLEALLAEAHSPGNPPRAAVPPCREQVRGARAQILSISAKLRSRSPADPRGVAKLRMLLSDGASPIYVRIHPTALTLALDDVWQWLDAVD